MKLRVGIGILSYNRPDSLKKCLNSLFENLTLPANVVISFDLWNVEFQDIAEQYPICAITGTQQGIPYANNRLLKIFADYDACFLVQDDIRFLRCEWLEYYLRGLSVVPYLAFFDPYYPQDPKRPRHFKSNYFNRRQSIIEEGVKLWSCHKSPQGAFQAVSRRCLEEVGYFDTGFGVYGLEHHDYWLRTCNAGFSPPEHFYDIEQSTELLKIDWHQPPSLTKQEKDTASRQSKYWRQKLFKASQEGFRRIKVTDKNADIQILRKGPKYQETPLDGKKGADFLSKEYWVYPTRIPIIAYHAIDDAPGDRYAVSPAQFKLQVQILAQHFQFVTASQAFSLWQERRHFPKNLAILTFDDGYRDFISITSLLAEYNIKATIFISTRWVGKENIWDRGAFTTRKHLDWPELREIAAMGHEVGSHAVDHYRLTRLDPDQISYELIESKAVLGFQLNKPICSIAYPFGSMNEEIARIVQTHYSVGFVAGQGGVFNWDEGLHSIRRIPVKMQEDPSSLFLRIANYMTQAPKSEPVWSPNHRKQNEQHKS